MPTPVAISLGANLGDRLATIESALDLLANSAHITQFARSSIFETKPIGGPNAQPPFLNAAAVFETADSPDTLFRRLREIETQLGRVRTTRWAPRTIDLDLLLFGQLRLRDQRLCVPHPRLCSRAFVLVPLAEIAPDRIEPTSATAIAHLAHSLLVGPRHVQLSGFTPTQKTAALQKIPKGWTLNDSEVQSRQSSVVFCARPIQFWDNTSLDPGCPVVWLEETEADQIAAELAAACAAADDRPTRFP
jgi:2-amino-4-hydroxy-6-hydroxymethyldihydropteridine diphosphokinase